MQGTDASYSEKDSILPTNSSFGHSLRQLNRLIQRDLGLRIAHMGVSLGQWYALRTLWTRDGLTQVQLAHESGIAGPAMVVAVRSLIAAGLVRRRRDPSDARKYIVSLTKKGRQLQTAALEAAIAANRDALQGIPGEDVATCMRVLHQAHHNLLTVGIPIDSEDDVDKLLGT